MEVGDVLDVSNRGRILSDLSSSHRLSRSVNHLRWIKSYRLAESLPSEEIQIRSRLCYVYERSNGRRRLVRVFPPPECEEKIGYLNPEKRSLRSIGYAISEVREFLH